jgi:AraC-like DNA-binding protein
MPLESPTEFQADFFRQNPLAESILRLFDALPQTYFYAKDRQSRFVKVNSLFLENHGLQSELEAIGKSDRDFHPPLMAEAYIREDQRVMAGRQQVGGQVWMVLQRRRTPRWYVSTKTPLFNAGGDVIGIAGAMYLIQNQEELASYLQELLPVVSHIEANFDKPISMAEMAKRANLSTTHFNRRFQQILRMTPMQYLRTLRIQAAQRLLTTTSKSLVAIAAEVGYIDQSHLTRRFRQATGITPAAYRKQFVRRMAT